MTPGFKRTRLAPTPSGFLHLGNLYSFVITVGIAREFDAKILLRIDDLDQERANPNYVQNIFDTLYFLDIPWHEGPRNSEEFYQTYSQAARKTNHDKLLHKLKNQELLFPCICSRSQLRRNNQESYPGTCRESTTALYGTDAAWRVKTDDRKLLIQSLNGDYLATTLSPAMKDFIVKRKDGIASYQLASLTDDIYFEVDLVIRGEDLWSSTQAQVFLADLLELDHFRNCSFIHHPLIKDESGDKLSKSAGATSIKYLREQGLSANDIYNNLGKLLAIDADTPDWQSLYQHLRNKLDFTFQTPPNLH